MSHHKRTKPRRQRKQDKVRPGRTETFSGNAKGTYKPRYKMAKEMLTAVLMSGNEGAVR